MEQKIRRDLNIGANLRALRDKSGLSQEKLCAELQRRGCDIGRTTYAKYESGELNIKASVIVTLKKIYNCSYDDFFAGLEEEIKQFRVPQTLPFIVARKNNQIFTFMRLICIMNHKTKELYIWKDII